jgi:23S rRNA pseudouridine2605 synthase
VLDQRVLDLAQISQNLRCKKGTRAKKVKINTKVAEVVSDKVKKNQAPKRPKVKDEIRLNKYINSGAYSVIDAIQSET